MKWEYAPAGLSDLVVYFVRRIFGLLKPGGFTAFITTNSIKDGDIRKDGLEQVLAQGGEINMAVRGIKVAGTGESRCLAGRDSQGRGRAGACSTGAKCPTISAFFEDSTRGRRAIGAR